MKKLQIIFVVVFCAMIFGGGAATWLYPVQEYSDLENRTLTQKPKLKLKKILKGSYQTKYETYLSDQFPLRETWVSLAAEIQKDMGKKEVNDVYLGKADYLLEKEDEVDAQQAEENITYLSTFLNDAMERYGKERVSCIMIPSKAEVLTNRLPDYVTVPENGQTISTLKNNLLYPERLFDLQETLQQHNQEYIYYRTDHHWTTLGAYYGYQAWAEALGQVSSHALEEYDRQTGFVDFYGTTYNKAHLKVQPDQVELFYKDAQEEVSVSMDDGEVESDTLYFPEKALEGFNRYDVFLSKNTFKIEITTKADTGKTLLLVKDSFANCFVPFLTEEYDKIILIDYRYGKTPIGKIMSQNSDITDVLVMFNTEKFLANKKLSKLADTETSEGSLQTFRAEDFLE